MIDIEINNVKPQANELEITLIGAGCEAGESVVVHLANGKWMVIDSCKSGGKGFCSRGSYDYDSALGKDYST